MDIKEISNNNYRLKKYKMKNDQIIEGINEPMPTQYSFSLLICGKPASGKTNLWLNMLRKTKKKNTYYQKFDRCYIFSNSLKTIDNELLKLPPERLQDGINNLEEILLEIKDTDDRCLIILDDCITDIKNQDYILKMVLNRRHIAGGLSIIIISQVFNKLACPLRKCMTDVILFNTTNKKEIKSFYDDLVNIPLENFNQIITYCFSGSSHDFIFFKTENSTFYYNFNKLELEYK